MKIHPDFSILRNKKILVVGDIMLDRYLWGEVARISPEAPVPVFRIKDKSQMPGGSANVAANLAGLNGNVVICGITGADEDAEHLKSMLERSGIEMRLIEVSGRPTTAKIRVMAQGQQLIRLDEEETVLFPPETCRRIIDELEQVITDVAAVIISDYGKGMFESPDQCRRIIRMCRKRKIPVLVDPKGTDWEKYRGATCITPNTAELAAVTTPVIKTDEKVFLEAAGKIQRELELSWLLVTRGAEGMCIIGPDGNHIMIPARAREVFDVSGAGDTVIAALAAGIAMGMPFSDSSELANMCAGIVVGKLGTQPVCMSDLTATLKMNAGERPGGVMLKVASCEAAAAQVRSWKASGRKVVFTNGCFDLLHPGHIDLLHRARDLGDKLIVGLNTDASVKRLKGESRPILSQEDRAAMLSSLSCVDMVVFFDEDTPLNLIRSVRPDILVKGADYKKTEVVGWQDVESRGGKVELVPLLQGYSTTAITDRIVRTNGNNRS